MQVGFGFWSSKVLLSAVELGIFTELARSPGDVESVRTRVGLHPRAARDFLDTLVALGFLQREDGVYRNTSDTDLFLDRNKPSYIGGILEMANVRLYATWGALTQALRTGKPQSGMKEGATVAEMLHADPEGSVIFLRAMSAVSRGANMAIARQFPWSKYRSVVDLGTAQGDLVVQITTAHPHLTAIGFDFPPVRPVFERYVAEHGVADRARFVEGDFFADPIPSADVIIMGHILHGVGLDDKQTLVRKAYDALPEGGALIVYEALIDDERRTNAFGLLMSLNMLVETREGFDYTGADCTSWLRAAGFRETRVEHLVGPDSMVVGIK